MANRYVCDVLKEMRTAIKVGRIDMLAGLIEEVQTMANRMEAKLADYSEIGYDLERGWDFRAKLRCIKEQARNLEKTIEQSE